MKISTDILLVSFTDIETEAVFKEFLIDPRELVSINGRQYWDCGIHNNSKVMLIRSGMGSGGVNGSQVNLDLAIRDLSPKAVVGVGIAFGADKKSQKIGTVLVSSQLILYEMQKITTEGTKTKIILRGDRPSSSPKLLKAFQDSKFSWPEYKTFGVHVGPLLTGEKLVDNEQFLGDLLASSDGEAVGGEMEGGGIYVATHSAAMNGNAEYPVHWIVVKSVCDWGFKKAEKKATSQRIAASSAASFVKHMLTTCNLGFGQEKEVVNGGGGKPNASVDGFPFATSQHDCEVLVDFQLADAGPSFKELESLAYKAQTASLMGVPFQVRVLTDIANGFASQLALARTNNIDELEIAELTYKFAKADKKRRHVEAAIETLVLQRGLTGWFANNIDYATAMFELMRLVKGGANTWAQPTEGHSFDFFYRKNPYFSFRILLSDEWINEFCMKNKLPTQGWNRILTGNYGLEVFDLPNDYVVSHVIPRFAFAVGFQFDLTSFDEKEKRTFFDLTSWTFGLA